VFALLSSVYIDQCFSTFSLKLNLLQQFCLLAQTMDIASNLSWGAGTPKGRNLRLKAVSGAGTWGVGSETLPSKKVWGHCKLFQQGLWQSPGCMHFGLLRAQKMHPVAMINCRIAPVLSDLVSGSFRQSLVV